MSKKIKLNTIPLLPNCYLLMACFNVFTYRRSLMLNQKVVLISYLTVPYTYLPQTFNDILSFE